MNRSSGGLIEVNELLRQAEMLYEEESFERALEIFQQLALLGVAEAYKYIGLIYRYGEGVLSEGSHQSEIWFSRYIDQLHENLRNGDLESGYILALSYQYGDMVEIDEEMAKKLFMSCAEKGHGPSQFRLSTLWRYGWCGLEVDIERCMHWLDRAISSEYPEALYQKGLDLVNMGGKEAEVQAMTLISNAAQRGFWPAEDYLKNCSIR
ncbi:tetratricopeptide repeat protein [Parachitinimonas caeni]|uniref:Sel1 repeat family protein n=1 Tax=Parachitinimonas caeni TaxID=3031301 RepID=A0ABT7DZ23_9NEIS|nr:hypothetical protein [Parachitinimonas caeni]MDK2125310.1 hypothetical protein [Parachitinimonas caeni]